MKPRIETLPAKKLIGQCIEMTISEDRTRELWRHFMPRRAEIKNQTGTELYSAEVYEPSFFRDFDAVKPFQKWAAVEVWNFNQVPYDMETLILPKGTYAVFTHKGPAHTAPETYRYIYTSWLPKSGYTLSNRPHFAVMDENYRPEDENSEEEIWIPVNTKQTTVHEHKRPK